MQICRTNLCGIMKGVSLIRTAEGFARRPNDSFEVFDMIEFSVLKKLGEIHFSELCRCLHCFASLGYGRKVFYDKVCEGIFNEHSKLSASEAVDVL